MSTLVPKYKGHSLQTMLSLSSLYWWAVFAPVVQVAELWFCLLTYNNKIVKYSLCDCDTTPDLVEIIPTSDSWSFPRDARMVVRKASATLKWESCADGEYFHLRALKYLRAGMRLDWDIGVEKCPPAQPKRTLNVVDTYGEALTNILKGSIHYLTPNIYEAVWDMDTSPVIEVLMNPSKNTDVDFSAFKNGSKKMKVFFQNMAPNTSITVVGNTALRKYLREHLQSLADRSIKIFLSVQRSPYLLEPPVPICYPYWFGKDPVDTSCIIYKMAFPEAKESDLLSLHNSLTRSIELEKESDGQIASLGTTFFRLIIERAIRSDGKLSELYVTRLARELIHLYGNGRKHSVSFEEFLHERKKAGLQDASQEKLLHLLTFLPVCSSRTTTVNEPVGLFCRRRSAREMRRKGQWPWDWTEDYLAGYKHMSRTEFDTNVGLSRNIKGATFRQTWRILGQSPSSPSPSILQAKINAFISKAYIFGESFASNCITFNSSGEQNYNLN